MRKFAIGKEKCLKTPGRIAKVVPSCLKFLNITNTSVIIHDSVFLGFHAAMKIDLINRFASSTRLLDGHSENCGEFDGKSRNPLQCNTVQGKVMFNEFSEGDTPNLIPLPSFDDGNDKVHAPPHIHELSDEILHLSMLEMNELVQRVGEHFSIKDLDENNQNNSNETENDEISVGVQEEKSLFDLKLVKFNAKEKIKVIKEIRSITSLGLKEAKELVENAPKVIKNNIKLEEAEKLKSKLENSGAHVEIT